MKYTGMIKKISGLSFLFMIGNSCFAQGPFTIGTIHPGDSVVIIYDVTINTPLVPANTSQISNQGTVSGSNFANVLTNDPDTGPAADATITSLNSFPLPVTFTEFKAYQKSNNIEVAWRILTEYNTLKYDVEKSIDGRTFTKIGQVTARGITNYTFLDVNPFAGNNFYRLKIIDNDAASKYTSIVRVFIGGKEMMSLYPNPISEKTVNLELRNVAKGQYQFTLYSISGQKIYTTIIQHNGGSASQVISIPASVSRGMYHVQVTGGAITINKKMMID